MKKTFLTLLVFCASFAMAQDFDKNLASARTSYGSGDLENARFAMEQMLQSLDAVIGKEILKLLPTKLDALIANMKEDNVNGGSAGFAGGLYVHRSYGTDPKTGSIDIVNNSPIISMINATLALPFLANSGDGNQKVVKVQGYKSVLNKTVNDEGTNYELQIPMNNTLITFKMDKCSEADMLRLAGTFPLPKISQVAQ